MARLDDDDMYAPFHLENLANAYLRYWDSVAFVYSLGAWRATGRLPAEPVPSSFPSGWWPPRFTRMLHSTASWRLSLIPLRYHGVEQRAYRNGQIWPGDGDLWERVCQYLLTVNYTYYMVPNVSMLYWQRHETFWEPDVIRPWANCYNPSLAAKQRRLIVEHSARHEAPPLSFSPYIIIPTSLWITLITCLCCALVWLGQHVIVNRTTCAWQVLAVMIAVCIFTLVTILTALRPSAMETLSAPDCSKLLAAPPATYVGVILPETYTQSELSSALQLVELWSRWHAPIRMGIVLDAAHILSTNDSHFLALGNQHYPFWHLYVISRANKLPPACAKHLSRLLPLSSFTIITGYSIFHATNQALERASSQGFHFITILQHLPLWTANHLQLVSNLFAQYPVTVGVVWPVNRRDARVPSIHRPQNWRASQWSQIEFAHEESFLEQPVYAAREMAFKVALESRLEPSEYFRAQIMRTAESSGRTHVTMYIPTVEH